MRRPRATSTLLLAAALSGGVPEANGVVTAADSSGLAGTAWVVAELPGHRPEPDRPATLRFEKGRVHGFDGCNRFTAPYKAQGTALEISLSGASTMMACPLERVHQAQAFAGALSATKTFRIEDGLLELVDFADGVLATLAPQPADMAGTSWRATALNNGRRAVASVVKDSNVTLEFLADGQAAGSAGCNRYTTRYVAEGASLEFAPAAATRMMCPRPELMEQEERFLKALATVASARFEGDRLELRTGDGALAVVLERTTRR